MMSKKKELLKSLGIFEDVNLKNITRIGSETVKNGWWLRVQRDGKKISKTFSDDDYGNPSLSLRKALVYRDCLKPKKITSNSGYHYISISTYSGKESPMIRANYLGEEKAFNIATYGYLFALKEAMQWLNTKDNSLYSTRIKLDLDTGLTYLNKNICIDNYLKILEKTLLHKQSDGLYFTPTNRQKTILILTNKNSLVVSKDPSFTYNKYIKNILKFIRKNGYDFEIENDCFKYNKNDYFAVVVVKEHTSSKEFCFRIRKLIDFSKKEFYTIQKTSDFFRTIYKDNPTVKKEIINIIPDFQTLEELREYLFKQKAIQLSEKKDLLRKRDKNSQNVEYAKRKDKQIGYVSKIIHDYDRLLSWSNKI